ncbi:uncharacterized protein LOC132912015 [Bombus pascuorum]|uniref:uncharacterized protein LOC132912015 n=1 Tax=Bombus pascuorum TaxID=65598 RepID=UPI00298D6232|nr:uncharacterized protein LOC132912015 [Bombus pascuorum]
MYMFASPPLFFFNFFHTIFVLCLPIVLLLKKDLKQIPFFSTNNRAKHRYPQSPVFHYRKRGSSPWPKRRENETRANKRAIDTEEEEEEEGGGEEEEEEEEAEGVAKDAGFRIEGFGERIRLSFDDSAGSWFEDTVAPRRLGVFPSAVYISQNQIGSKVHSPNSPSSSKEVRTGNTSTDRKMQSLIPLLLALSLASAVRLNLVPYAYLSSPVPVFNHFQNTRTGEHAYSYAGGPSAKEEIKDADGILRGSYSYVDANGILQSAFYVADEKGFRVAATNIPSDENSNSETTGIVLAGSAGEASWTFSRRRRRSLEDSNVDSNENNGNRNGQSENFDKDKGKYGAQDSPQIVSQPLLLSNDIPLATSHQSQVQVHSSARLDVAEGEAKAKPVDLQPILPVQTILEGLPVLARAPTYHENRIELHKQLGIEGPSPKDAVKINPEPLTIVRSSPPANYIASTIVPRGTVAAVPVIAEQAIPVIPAVEIGTSSVTTSISSHGVSQIHGPWKITDEDVAIPGIPSVVAKESIPVAVEKKNVPITTAGIVKEAVPVIPTAKEADLATATVTTSVFSHGISQIHGDSKVKIEPAWLVKATPIAQLHPVVNVPIYSKRIDPRNE